MRENLFNDIEEIAFCDSIYKEYAIEELYDDILEKIDNNKKLSKYEKDILWSKTNDYTPQSKKELIKIVDKSFDKKIYNLNFINTSNVKIMDSIFNNDQINFDVSEWDVSNVISMAYMFCDCSLFNCDLSKWNVSNVTDMCYMFYNCENFTSDLSKWDVSKVKDMSRMFYNCRLFNSDLSKWDISKVSDLSGTFNECNNFTSDLSKWNTSIVISTYECFKNCFNFESDLSTWNTSNIKYMQEMFYGCTKFNSDLSKWNIDSAINMREMFYGCKSFFCDLSKWEKHLELETVNTNKMFEECHEINKYLNSFKPFEIELNKNNKLPYCRIISSINNLKIC